MKAALVLAMLVPAFDLTPLPVEEVDYDRNDALFAQVGASVMCEVRETGESECTNMAFWKRANRELPGAAAFLDRVYEENGLDRQANALLQCGDRWTTATADLRAILPTFAEGLPPPEQERARVEIEAVIAGDARGVLNVPGQAYVSEFARACGALSPGGSGASVAGHGGAPSGGRPPHLVTARSSESLQQQAADAWHERLDAQHQRMCGQALGRGSRAVQSGSSVVERVTQVGQAANEWARFQRENNGSRGGFRVTAKSNSTEKTMADGTEKTYKLTTVTLEKNGKKSTYVRSSDRAVSADGRHVESEDHEACATEGWFTDNECSDLEMETAREAADKKEDADSEAAQKQKENDEKSKKAAPTASASSPNPPASSAPSAPPNGVRDPVRGDTNRPFSYDCNAAQQFWETFLTRCDGNLWTEYQCRILIGMRCMDPGVVTPIAGGDLICVDSAELTTDVAAERERACSARGEIALCTAGGCHCHVAPPTLPRPWSCAADPRCNPGDPGFGGSPVP